MNLKLFGNNKGVFGLDAIAPAVISILIAAVVAVLGLQLLGEQKADLTANSTEANATQKAIDGVAKFPSYFPMIAGVIALVIVISILVRAFQTGK